MRDGHGVSRCCVTCRDVSYRPRANVLARPRGKAIAITGHHEILLPLIRAGVVAALKGKKIKS